MKISTVFLLFMVMKINASFFDDFRGAMSSVESSFGKLLNDVVTDVKSTMHCTILAMEQVLAMHGVIPEPINSKDCDAEDNHNNLDIKSVNEKRKLQSAKDIAQEISISISNVNKSLNHVLENESHQRLEDIRKEFKNESTRLEEVSFLLRQELQKISQRMKKEFQNIHLDFSNISLDSVLNDMKTLYEVEKNDENDSEVSEISKVFNEALNVLHVNTGSEIKSDEDKIEVIMRELEKQPIINKILLNNKTHELDPNNQIHELEPNNKTHELDPNNKIHELDPNNKTHELDPNNKIHELDPNKKTHELDQQRGECSTLQNKLDHKEKLNVTSTFNDVVSKFKHENTTKKTVNEYITDKSNNVVNNKLVNEKIKVADNKIEAHKTDSKDASSFSEINSAETLKAIEEAMDIFRDAADTQNILGNFFSEEHGVNVF